MRMRVSMKKRIIFLVLMLLTIGLQAKDVIGDWYGILDVQGTQLKVVFHLERKADTLTATMDSPDQNAIGLLVDEATFKDGELFLNAKSMGISYKGIPNKAMDSIDGTFMQGAVKLDLKLERNEQEKKVINRSQDPKNFPYYREDVIFENKNAGIKLAGTLTLPKDKKASKIVILISGSGPQNRNEEVAIFNHRPFLVWSDWLTKQGIGVLRYDDRGVGKSTGDFDDATSADFANDTEAAVNYILSRNDLKDLSIGLMGHSEGGIIAPMVAARNKNIEFVVLLAGPGISIDKLLIQQMEDIAILENVPEKISKLNVETSRKLLVYLKEHKKSKFFGWGWGKDKKDISEDLENILREELKKYQEEALEGASIDEIIEREVKTHTGKWFRFFATYDPRMNLKKVTCPVLAVNGTLDCQVNCKSNLKAIREALEKGGNKHFEIVPMEGMNHVLQKAKTGAISEYSRIDETVNPKVLTKVSEWINNLK